VANNISGIDGAPSPAKVPSSIGASRPVARPQDAASDSTSSAKDSSPQDVQITGTARQLADLDQQVRNAPDVNEQKVAQLRSAIEQGTYQVRPRHIADQLMSLERSLGSLPDGE
jgi:negative regulator of flagellin synthesis FlgM